MNNWRSYPLSKCFGDCLPSWQIQSTPLCLSEQLFSVVCLPPPTKKKKKQKQAIWVTLSKLISFCLCVNSRKNSCHFDYADDLEAVTFAYFVLPLSSPSIFLPPPPPPPPYSIFLAAEKCEGGNPVKADQLLPEMEEEVLQTPREDPLLCQRLQGTKTSETSCGCMKPKSFLI